MSPERRDPIRVAVLGTGAISQIVYLPILAEREDVDLVAVSDVDAHKAQTLADRFGVHRVTDDEELFGIFRGIPWADRESATTSLPAQSAIFREPILRSCATRGEAVREIRDTVVHEIGHMLGLGDEEMPY